MRADYASRYAGLYQRHWWWRAREAILLAEIGRLDLPRPAHVLDFGCGNGLFLPRLAALGPVTGLEPDRSLVTPDAPMREHVRHEALDDAAWGSETFDLAVALDVLEHLADDDAAVASLARRLRPGGFLVVTVPAFACLWDAHDDANHHLRRYRLPGLTRMLAGHLEVVRSRYLFPSLFPPKLAVALLNRHRRRPVEQDRIPPPALNALLRRWLLGEDAVARVIAPPFGTSALAVARRPTGP